MPNYIQSSQEIDAKFEQQLDLIGVLCDAYDSGAEVVALSIATALRVLLHESRNSKSLRIQAGKSNIELVNTAMPFEAPPAGKKRLGSFLGLVGMTMGTGSPDEMGYVPMLDGGPSTPVLSAFDDYWNQVIFMDTNCEKFTRCELVLYVSDKDGGAHVDPRIPQRFAALVRQNSLGWRASHNQIEFDMPDVELAAIRQIAHEVLKSYRPSYVTRVDPTDGALMVTWGNNIYVNESAPVGCS